MNHARSKEIARAIALVVEARALIEQAGNDEQEFFDAMPESI